MAAKSLLLLGVAAATVVAATAAEDSLPYCSHAQAMALRGVPAVPPSFADRLRKTHALTRVVGLVRHGSRAPCKLSECWPGYRPTLEWGCGVDSVEAPALPAAVHGRDDEPNEEAWGEEEGGQRAAGPTLFFKISEAEPEPFRVTELSPLDQETNGLCYLGQLLPEGLQQHVANGHALRRAYYGDAAAVAPLVAEGEVLAEEALFLRSSDLPRTVASGQALLTAFLGGGHEDGDGYFGDSSARVRKSSALPRRPRWFAPELSSDYLYANAAACPRLAEWQEEIFGSEAYGHWWATGEGHPGGGPGGGPDSGGEAEAAAAGAVAPADVADEFTLRVGGAFPWGLSGLEGPALDCVMTNECSGKGLPEAVYDSWQPEQGVPPPPPPPSSPSSSSLLRATAGVLSQAEAFKLQANHSGWSRLAMAPLADHLRRLLQAPPSSSSSSPVVSNRSPRFSLFAAHDTTLNPLLAALLGNEWDGEWAPYASMMLFEAWTPLDSSQDPLFRMIYNGQEETIERCRESPSSSSSSSSSSSLPLCALEKLLAQLDSFALPVGEWAAGPCARHSSSPPPPPPLLAGARAPGTSGGAFGSSDNSGGGGGRGAVLLLVAVLALLWALRAVGVHKHFLKRVWCRNHCRGRRSQYTEIPMGGHSLLASGQYGSEHGGVIELPHSRAAAAAVVTAQL